MNDWFHDTLAAMVSPGPWRSFRHVFEINFLADGARWLVISFVLWGLLHVALRRRLAHRVIRGWPDRSDLHRELVYSFSSLAVLTAANCAVLAGAVSGVFEIYNRPLAHGWVWLVISLPLLIVWHDAYFYWTHRLLHTRWLFRHVHHVHHRSREPSPYTAFSFHPIEALVQIGVLPLALCVVPLNDGVLLAFTVHYFVRSAHGHAGVETMPRGFARHWLGGLFATTTHHHLHHETGRGDYALWFTWWDHWCGTERAEYLERFDQATAPRPST
jgi:sterol desaturase/sphingolipid hydroxylase (fatty acid hydroxylase superfamily)